MRFSSPGQTWRRLTEKRTLATATSRKSALWPRPRGAPHQKTHSGGSGARRMRLSVTSNPRMRFSVECAFPHLGKRRAASRKSAFCAGGLTQKRTLPQRSHGKPHSVPDGSRKTALCPRHPSVISRKSAFYVCPSPKDAFCAQAVTQSASFRETLQPECAFP
mgnify:CR=1 FL=1